MSNPIIRAKDVMQKEILSIDGMASSKEAADLMRSSKSTELLVNRRNESDAWGIVTVMDLVKSVIVPDKKPDNIFVYEIMTKPVITIPAQMDVRYVIRLMQRIGVRRAPVEENGEIVGMITLYNLVLNSGVL